MEYVLATQLALLTTIPLLGAPPAVKKGETARVDRYGDPLPPGAVARLGTVRLRDSHALAFSPDGKLLATVGSKAVRLWETTTGKEVRRFSLPPDLNEPQALAFSPDGRKIVVINDHGAALAVWNVNQTKPLFSAKAQGFGTSVEANRITFSADSKTLYTGNDQSIYCWDAATGRKVSSFRHSTEDGNVNQIVFTRDGKFCLTASDGPSVAHLWDTQTGRKLHGLRTPQEDGILCAAFRNDGGLVATGNATRILRLWDVKSGKEAGQLEHEEDATVALAFKPDGKELASATQSENRAVIRLWDVSTKPARLRKTIAAPGIGALEYSPDGKTLAWICQGSIVRLVDAATGAERPLFASHEGSVHAVAYAPDGRQIATGGADGTIRLWEAGTGKQQAVLRGHTEAVEIVAFSRDGKWLASASGEGKVVLWSLETQTKRVLLMGEDESTPIVAFAPDGKVLVIGAGGKLLFWDVKTGKQIHEVPEGDEKDEAPGALVFSADGRLLTLARERSIHLYDAATRRQLRTLDIEQAVHSLAFSPDGRTLACGSDEQLILWELASGKPRARVAEGPGKMFGPLALSPDGRLLAACYCGEADPDITPHVWELATGRQLGVCTGHEESVLFLAFSPDGRRLATTSDDATALVWDLDALRQRGPHPVLENWPARKKLTAKGMESAWADLAGADAVKAQSAVWSLAALPQQAAPFLRQRLHPVIAPDSSRAATLIADLDSDQFSVREKASAELARLGVHVQAQLRKKLVERPSPEARRRIRALLAKLPVLEAPSAEELRQVRAVEALEQMGTPEAIRLLLKLADGAEEARLTREAKDSLGRLVRRETP